MTDHKQRKHGPEELRKKGWPKKKNKRYLEKKGNNLEEAIKSDEGLGAEETVQFHKCDVCGNEYKHKHKLKDHKQRKHGPDELKKKGWPIRKNKQYNIKKKGRNIKDVAPEIIKEVIKSDESLEMQENQRKKKQYNKKKGIKIKDDATENIRESKLESLEAIKSDEGHEMEEDGVVVE